MAVSSFSAGRDHSQWMIRQFRPTTTFAETTLAAGRSSIQSAFTLNSRGRDWTWTFKQAAFSLIAKSGRFKIALSCAPTSLNAERTVRELHLKFNKSGTR